MCVSNRLSSILASTLLLIFASFSAHAVVIPKPPSTVSFQGEYQCCSINLNYDADTEILSTSVAFGTAALPAVIFNNAFFPGVVTDIVGTFDLSAQVDHLGQVSGGSYSWTGSSATLGIAAPQVLLSGSILGSLPESEHVGSLFADIGIVNPAFAGLGPTPDFAVLSFVTGGFCFCNLLPNYWSSDRVLTVHQPDIIAYASVPEPASLTLLAAGFMGFWLAKNRRKSNATSV